MRCGRARSWRRPRTATRCEPTTWPSGSSSGRVPRADPGRPAPRRRGRQRARPLGGYRLARAADEITLADIIRAVDGPLVTVRDERPTALEYAGSAQALLEVWVALRVSVRDVLDRVTLAGLVSGELPPTVHELAARHDAWVNP